MDKSSLLELLAQVQRGALTPDAAAERVSALPFAENGYEDIGHARIDHHRALRTGLPEVIYAAGKTPEQTAEIFSRMAAVGHAVLATRTSPEAAAAVLAILPEAVHNPIARTVALAANQQHPGRLRRRRRPLRCRALRRHQRPSGRRGGCGHRRTLRLARRSSLRRRRRRAAPPAQRPRPARRRPTPSSSARAWRARCPRWSAGWSACR